MSWLPVVGYEGLYEVSDWGRVKSCTRVVMRKGGRPKPCRERILKQSPTKGYLCVTLSKNGVHTTKRVHRLVLEAFVGPCPKGMEGLHGPKGSLDNSLQNLHYGTPVENQRDRIRDGTAMRGEKHPGALLSMADVREIRERVLIKCERKSVLAREYGVSWRTIRDAALGVTYSE